MKDREFVLENPISRQDDHNKSVLSIDTRRIVSQVIKRLGSGEAGLQTYSKRGPRQALTGSAAEACAPKGFGYCLGGNWTGALWGGCGCGGVIWRRRWSPRKCR